MDSAAILSGLIFLGMSLLGSALILASVRFLKEDPAALFKLGRYGIIVTIASVVSAICVAIGLRLDSRHSESYSRGKEAVQKIWGGEIRQPSPAFTYAVLHTENFTVEKTGEEKTRQVWRHHAANFQAQSVKVNLRPSIRKKGLLFYAGYELQYESNYTIRNTDKVVRDFTFHFALPDQAGNITGFSVSMDGQVAENDVNFSDGYTWNGRLQPGDGKSFRITYQAKGSDAFTYGLAETQIEIRELDFELLSGYKDVRLPDQAMAPHEHLEDATGSQLRWKASQLITGQNIAVRFEAPGNWGKLAPRLFYYAPLALFLFLGTILVTAIGKKEILHPVHVFFLSAGFFVFYLLGSYLLSFVPVFVAILLALLVSSSIVIYYVFLIKKDFFMRRMSALALGIFQWLFSLAFFFPEYTGLLITLASIVCFVVLMRQTADIDWENKW
ncbi:MAG: hypothetical protein HS115_05950 [Spirochaetales bacterium]|nr:hypothetical protein [Spirochaetales bacterium]